MRSRERSRRSAVAQLVRCLVIVLVVAAARIPPAATAQGAQRIVAVGDVHGAFTELVAVLRAASLVDDGLAWTGGDARLVLLGDVVDRGAESRRALELVKALAEQAPRVGGRVELLLGNHEVMNLLGDLRYVTAAELAAYAADELPSDRDAAWLRFSAELGATPEARQRFAARYPPGFFAHRAAFAPSGALGSWLIERPVLVTIDGTAFVHGGLPGSIAGKTADDVTTEYRAALRDYLAAAAELEAAGLLQREHGLDERIALAERFVAGSSTDATLRRAAERVVALLRSPLLSGESVLWYRGTAACSAAIEQTRLDAVLASLGAERVVIGHTPTREGVVTRLAGRVVRADTGMLPAYGGRPAAVVIRGDDVHALYAGSTAEGIPEPQRRAVGVQLPGVDGDDELERFLAAARVRSRMPRADGTELWQLEHGDTTVDAVFRPAPRRGFATLPDVAAYRLDRLLGLDLVPVAVPRAREGRVGSLLLDPAQLPTEAERAAEPTAEATCPLRDQFNAMYVFDALAHNDSRRPDAIRYRRADWSVTLTSNETSFGTASDLPISLRQAPLEVPVRLAERLRALDEGSLQRSVGDVLDARRRTALLERRDRLLGRP